MRGEFIRGDGFILPNNLTPRATALILGLFKGVEFTLVAGLGSGVYTPTVSAAELNEPSFGIGGYERASIPGYADIGTFNGESYLETNPFVFNPIGVAFNQTVNRIFLHTDGVDKFQPVFALGSPFPEIRMAPNTPIADRTFRYRLYLR